MNGLLALMALTPAAEMDGEAAIRIAQDFAKRARYKAPYSLTFLKKMDMSPYDKIDEKEWVVGLKSGSFALTMNIAMRGQVTYFCLMEDTRQLPPPPSDEKMVQRGKELFARLPHKGHILAGDLGIGAWSYGMDFNLLLKGRRFFNLNPRYGYYMSFDPTGSRVTWFGASDVLPPVNSHVPKVSPQAASRLFLTYASWPEIQPHLDPFKKGSIKDVAVESRLGYYKPKEALTARLVYLGHARSTLKDRSFDYEFEMPFFVDAITGKAVPKDDR